MTPCEENNQSKWRMTLMIFSGSAPMASHQLRNSTTSRRRSPRSIFDIADWVLPSSCASWSCDMPALFLAAIND